MAQWLTNLTRIYEDVRLIPGLSQLRIQHCHGLCTCIPPLAWELPYAKGVALKSKKKKKKKERKKEKKKRMQTCQWPKQPQDMGPGRGMTGRELSACRQTTSCNRLSSLEPGLEPPDKGGLVGSRQVMGPGLPDSQRKALPPQANSGSSNGGARRRGSPALRAPT